MLTLPFCMYIHCLNFRRRCFDVFPLKIIDKGQVIFSITLTGGKSQIRMTKCFKGCTAPKTCCILCNEVVRGPCHFIYACIDEWRNTEFDFDFVVG